MHAHLLDKELHNILLLPSTDKSFFKYLKLVQNSESSLKMSLIHMMYYLGLLLRRIKIIAFVT